MDNTQKKIKRLKNKLDQLIQAKYVEENPFCLVCGNCTSEMHHYIEKSRSMNLRWDKENLVPLCRHCHCKIHIEGDPRINQIIVKKKGHAWADKIEERRREIFKPTLTNLKIVEKGLDEKEVK